MRVIVPGMNFLSKARVNMEKMTSYSRILPIQGQNNTTAESINEILPSEILTHILNHLPIVDFSKASLTCKLWSFIWKESKIVKEIRSVAKRLQENKIIFQPYLYIKNSKNLETQRDQLIKKERVYNVNKICSRMIWFNLTAAAYVLIFSDDEKISYMQNKIIEFNNFNYISSKNFLYFKFNLNNIKLTSLEPEIGLLTNFTELSICFNPGLKTLPPEIGKLRNLERFICHNNKLKLLPAEIGHLTQLINLDVSSNRLSFLPCEIGALKNLKRFDCSRNKLESIPSEISDLKQLQIIAKDNPLNGLNHAKLMKEERVEQQERGLKIRETAQEQLKKSETIPKNKKDKNKKCTIQ